MFHRRNRSLGPATRHAYYIVLILRGCIFATHATAISVDQLKTVIQEQCGQPQTGIIVYSLSKTATTSPPRLDSTPGLQNNTTARKPLPEENTVVKLNHQSTMASSTLTFDSNLRTYKVEQIDLRNLDQIMRENNLPEAQLANLSKTKNILSGDSNYVTLHGPALIIAQPAVKDTDPTVWHTHLPVDNGNITPAPFDEGWHGPMKVQIEEATLDGQSVAKVILERSSGVNATYYLDPKLNYRLLKAEVFIQGKLRLEEFAGNYKTINGIPFPFSHIRKDYDTDGNSATITTTQIESAQLNIDLPVDAFTINVPAKTKVYDIVNRSAGKVFPRDMRIDLAKAEILTRMWDDIMEYDAPKPSAAQLNTTVEMLAGNKTPTTLPAIKTVANTSQESRPAQPTATNPKGNTKPTGLGMVVAGIVLLAIIVGLTRSMSRPTDPN